MDAVISKKMKLNDGSELDEGLYPAFAKKMRIRGSNLEGLEPAE